MRSMQERQSERSKRLRRFVVVIIGLMVLLVTMRHLIRRGKILHRSSSPVRGVFNPAVSAAPASGVVNLSVLGRGDRTRILRAVRNRLARGQTLDLQLAVDERVEPIAVVSLSRPRQPALVAQGRGESYTVALESAVEDLERRSNAEQIDGGLLKIDLAAWVGPSEEVNREGRARIERSLEGLRLEKSGLVLLPEELLAWRIVDSKRKFRDGRLTLYLKEGGRGRQDGSRPRMLGPFRRLRFDSFIEGEDGLVERLYRGNLLDPDLSPQALLTSALAGGEYLLRHLKADGTFNYSYRPKRDNYDEGYNLLRHAGSCYALVELARDSGDQRFLAGAKRGLKALLKEARRVPRSGNFAGDVQAIVSPGEEAKLGGSALALLALVEYQRVSEDSAWLDQARAFARFLAFQQEESGHFRSKYFFGKPDDEPFESIYYPGEAILALTRLYRIDPNPDWLNTASKGADWLIEVRDQGKAVNELPHDHWLLIALNELSSLTVGDAYPNQAKKIAQSILAAQRSRSPWPDWIGTFYDPPRSTPTATRAEALVAMSDLARSREEDPGSYLEGLIKMAAFQRRTQFTAQSALYLRRPDLAMGGFRRSLGTWEVRIDYVQHNVSALLGLRRQLENH